MTLLMCEGFEGISSGTIDDKYWSGRSPSVITGTDRGNAVQCNFGGGESIRIPLPTQPKTIIFGAAFFFFEGPANDLVRFEDGDGNTHVQIEINGPGYISVRLGVTGAFYGFSTKKILFNKWYYIELKLTVDNSAGSVELRLNGETVVSASGVDTATSNLEFISNIRLGSIVSNNDVIATDIYVCDDVVPNNDFLGDINVEALFPSADGAVNDWTPQGGGDNYVEVDDTAPDDDTTYNSSTTINNRDLYEFDDISEDVDEVLGVQVNVNARKENGPYRIIQDSIRSGGVNYEGQGSEENFYLGDNYEIRPTMHDQNPNTSGQWTESEVNAAQFGVFFKS